MLKTKFEARIYLWEKLNGKESILTQQKHSHLDALLVNLKENCWEVVVQKLRAAENHNIHFEDDFLQESEQESAYIEVGIPSLDMVTQIPRTALTLDAYKVAADVLTAEALKTDDLEDVRQDLQSAMVEQCDAIILARREKLASINSKLVTVQSLLAYVDKYSTKRPSDGNNIDNSAEKSSLGGSKGFRSGDKSNLKSVAILNEKIIETRLRLEKAERYTRDLKDRIGIDEYTFANNDLYEDGSAPNNNSFIQQVVPFSNSSSSLPPKIDAIDLSDGVSKASPTVSKKQGKRRASTSAATLPLVLPAGSTLDEDCKSIIHELELWDTEKSKLDSEIADLELQILRKNRRLHSINMKLSQKQKSNGK